MAENKQIVEQISCGDWIYPSRDSRSGLQYPIDKPLVVSIFQELPYRTVVSPKSDILSHLCESNKITFCVQEEGGRFQMEVSVTFNFNPISFTIPFSPKSLARPQHIWTNKNGRYLHGLKFHDQRIRKSVEDPAKEEPCAIFFTSVLLQAYLNGIELPDGIAFREASPIEIEALGRWPIGVVMEYLSRD